MTPWFEPQQAVYFSVLGLVGLTGLTALWIKHGRHRTFVMGLWGGIGLAGIVLSVLGLMGLMSGQPDYVWIPMTASGAGIGLPYLALLPVLYWAYRKAEERRMSAMDL